MEDIENISMLIKLDISKSINDLQIELLDDEFYFIQLVDVVYKI